MEIRIDHVALWTNDLEGMRDYYCTFFGGVSNAKYENPKTGFSSYFVTFPGGIRLEIMHKPNISRENDRDTLRTGFVHLAFSVGSKANVETLTQRIRESGYQVLSEPRTTGDGYYESCVADPEGNAVEITI